SGAHNPSPAAAGSSTAVGPGEGGRRPPFDPFPRTGGGRWPEAGRGRTSHHRADASPTQRPPPSPPRGASPAGGGSGATAPRSRGATAPPAARGERAKRAPSMGRDGGAACVRGGARVTVRGPSAARGATSWTGSVANGRRRAPGAAG